MFHITAMVGKNATFSLHRHRRVELPTCRPVYGVDILRKIPMCAGCYWGAIAVGSRSEMCSRDARYLIQRKAVSPCRAAALAKGKHMHLFALTQYSPRQLHPVTDGSWNNRENDKHTPLYFLSKGFVVHGGGSRLVYVSRNPGIIRRKK